MEDNSIATVDKNNLTNICIEFNTIIEENGLYYILRNKAGIQTKILVKIEAQTDKFSIISSYSSKELQELGYDGKAIRNYKNINNYDEIIVNLQ